MFNKWFIKKLNNMVSLSRPIYDKSKNGRLLWMHKVYFIFFSPKCHFLKNITLSKKEVCQVIIPLKNKIGGF